MFAAPVAAGRAHAALHLIKNQQNITFVTNSAQLLQPFTAEMVVAPLALDRLDDNGANVDVALLDELVNLALGLLFPLNYVGFPLRCRQRKIDMRTRHAGPVEFSKQIRLARVSVRQAHGVTASPVKRVAEMQHLGAALAATSSHVLAHFPIHRGLQTILDRKRAALDKQITPQRRQPDDALKRRHKFSVAVRIDIRVSDLHLRRAQKVALYLRIIEVRMVESDRHRSEKSVEIDQSPIIDCIV